MLDWREFVGSSTFEKSARPAEKLGPQYQASGNGALVLLQAPGNALAAKGYRGMRCSLCIEPYRPDTRLHTGAGLPGRRDTATAWNASGPAPVACRRAR